MVSLNEKILLLLYLTMEEWDSGLEELAHPHRFFYSSFARRYKEKSIRQRLWELQARGVIRRLRKEGEERFQITAAGKKEVTDSVPILKYRREWDGLWRLAIFDIEEGSHHVRDKLRRKIQSLGFCLWQRSIYLTPFNVARDLNDYLERESLKGPVEILEARRLFSNDEKILAEKIWHLSKLNGQYLVMEEEWEEAKVKSTRDLELLKRLAAIAQEKYLTLFATAPGLTKERLPEDWSGDKVQRHLRDWISLQG